MATNVIAKGNFGYHPASGHHLQEGEQYTIDEAAFSDQLFERIGPDQEEIPADLDDANNKEVHE